MIVFETKKGGAFEFPDCWADLTVMEFTMLTELLYRMFSGELSVADVQFAAVGKITGYQPHWYPPRRHRQEENLYRLAEGFRFPFRESEKGVELNLDFQRNIMQRVKVGGYYFTGPKFELNEVDGNTTLETDFGAGAFVTCMEAYNQFVGSNNMVHLRRLFFAMYKNSTGTQPLHVPDGVLFGAFLLYKYMMEFITQKTTFSMLFGGSSDGKLSLGISETVFALVQDGFGSIEEVEAMEVDAFFGVLLSRRFNLVREMKARDAKMGEIVKASGLDAAVIIKL